MDETEVRRLALLEAAAIADDSGTFQKYRSTPYANDYELEDAAYSRGRADAAAAIRKAAGELTSER